MAKYVITIDTDNAAFEEDAACEIARILRYHADTLEIHGVNDSCKLRDVNDNTVGQASVEK